MQMRMTMPRRPKQRLDLLRLADQKFDAKLSLKDGRRLSKRELGVIKLVNRFVETGDPKIFKLLVEILHPGSGPEVIYRDPPSDVTRWTDNEVLEAFHAFWDRYPATPEG
jgi:hypothetical protein